MPNVPPPPAAGRERGRAAAALALLSFIWGYNWVVMKEVLDHASPLGVAAWRFLLGGLLLFPVLSIQRQPLGVPRAEWGLVLLLSAMLAANFAATFTALQLGGAGKTSVLVYTMPFWTLLLAHLFLRERMQPFQWFAAALACAGLVVLIDPAHLAGLLPSVLAVASGLSWGANMVIVKRGQHHTRTPMLTLMAWQMLIGSVLLFGATQALGTPPVRWTPQFIGAIAFMALVATALTAVLNVYALKRLPAGTTGLGMLATPVLSVLWSWLLLDERPSGSDAAGMALIGAGLALLVLPGAFGGTIGALANPSSRGKR